MKHTLTAQFPSTFYVDQTINCSILSNYAHIFFWNTEHQTRHCLSLPSTLGVDKRRGGVGGAERPGLVSRRHCTYIFLTFVHQCGKIGTDSCRTVREFPPQLKRAHKKERIRIVSIRSVATFSFEKIKKWPRTPKSRPREPIPLVTTMNSNAEYVGVLRRTRTPCE